jgi:hypothetical protein
MQLRSRAVQQPPAASCLQHSPRLSPASSSPPERTIPPPPAAMQPTSDDTGAWLQTVMKRERNRAMLASLEHALSAFVRDSGSAELPFPPKTPFFRKVCGAVANRYRLDSRLEQALDHPDGTVRLVLVKTSDSLIPDQTLAELVPLEPAHPPLTPAPTPSPAPAPQQPTYLATASASLSISPSTSESNLPALSQHAGSSSDLACVADVPGTPPSPPQMDSTRPATVLRRPTDGNVRGARGNGSFCAGTQGPSAIKNVTEEEYESYVSGAQASLSVATRLSLRHMY